MTDPALIDALRDPRCYPHPVDRVQVVETHISWILLTGAYAYKLKKPLTLGFLDFSTLSARKHFCEEELRLNRRLDPDLYLEVVAICEGPQRPVIGGQGPVLEYAVKMRQFPEEGLLDRVQERGELLPAHIDAMARQIAAFHQDCERAASDGAYGSPSAIAGPALQNFDQIGVLLPDAADRAQLEALRLWTEFHGHALAETFRARQWNGFVRECHGDLHLGNVFMERGAIQLFDCIEFNPGLRWIDVMSDVAFMVMDLWHRNHPDLARRFLNGYLEQSGDYAGVGTLAYYLVYRAMVRAKVVLIRSGQPEVGEDEKSVGRSECRRFLALAQRFAARPQPWIAITHGPSGSGKSHFAGQLLECCECVRIRSDVERKRAHGLGPQAETGSPVGAELYGEAATRATYAGLAALGAAVLEAGWPLIADATFLVRWQRDLLRQLARKQGLPLRILDFRAADAILRDRIRARVGQGGDPSEATLEVLERQLRTAEPLQEDELPETVVISPGAGPGPETVARLMQQSMDLTKLDR